MADEQKMLELAERVDDFMRRLEGIAAHPTLSPESQTRAVALLTTVNAGLFPQIAAALRSTQERTKG